ncbi:hypothetical protein LY78DRAFT_93137 [Colletotrichum sublineola]|nr:hypothetical protein LY78DRAFT_93137 [Colletotrichum sublineola]
MSRCDRREKARLVRILYANWRPNCRCAVLFCQKLGIDSSPFSLFFIFLLTESTLLRLSTTGPIVERPPLTSCEHDSVSHRHPFDAWIPRLPPTTATSRGC